MEYKVYQHDVSLETHLQICQTGWEYCEGRHSYGPAVRDHFLIHYVVSGSGMYEARGQSLSVSAGQGFLICPNEVTYYEADESDPWHYVWVGFKGARAERFMKEVGLGDERLIFETTKGEPLAASLMAIHEASKQPKGSECLMLGHLYLAFGILMAEADGHQAHSLQAQYAERACLYIERQYSRPLTVAAMASHLGLERSYFSNVFRNEVGLSPQQYLVSFRMAKACELLEREIELTVGDVARSVGYSDPLTFSRMFKSVTGVSPSGYRQQKMNQG